MMTIHLTRFPIWIQESLLNSRPGAQNKVRYRVRAFEEKKENIEQGIVSEVYQQEKQNTSAELLLYLSRGEFRDLHDLVLLLFNLEWSF